MVAASNNRCCNIFRTLQLDRKKSRTICSWRFVCDYLAESRNDVDVVAHCSWIHHRRAFVFNFARLGGNSRKQNWFDFDLSTNRPLSCRGHSFFTAVWWSPTGYSADCDFADQTRKYSDSRRTHLDDLVCFATRSAIHCILQSS